MWFHEFFNYFFQLKSTGGGSGPANKKGDAERGRRTRGAATYSNIDSKRDEKNPKEDEEEEEGEEEKRFDSSGVDKDLIDMLERDIVQKDREFLLITYYHHIDTSVPTY